MRTGSTRPARNWWTRWFAAGSAAHHAGASPTGRSAEQYTPPWTESPHVTTITLTGLAHAQGAELAGNVAKGKALPAEVLEQIVVRADGVPLYHRGVDQVGAGIPPAARRGRSLHAARAHAHARPFPRTLKRC